MNENLILEDVLDEIIRRIVKIADPEQVILFGSAVRGTMHENSDIDLLIIKQGSYNPREIAANIHKGLFGIGHAVDLVIVTPEQVDHYKNSPSLVVYPAIREGRVIYRARSVLA